MNDRRSLDCGKDLKGPDGALPVEGTAYAGHNLRNTQQRTGPLEPVPAPMNIHIVRSRGGVPET